MNYFKKLFIISFAFINITVYGQEDKEVLYAEIVTLKDENLIHIIDSLNLKNQCIRKGENWYLDFTREDYIVLSRAKLKNHIPTIKAKHAKIYLTLINNDVFLIFSKKEKDLLISKTDFKVDLGEFLNSHNYSIEESSYWILKDENGKTELVKEVLYGCN